MLKRTLIVSALALTIIACGSGSSDDKEVPDLIELVNDTNQEANATDTDQILNDANASENPDVNQILNDTNATEGSNTGSDIPDLDTTLKKGYLIDAPVEGVAYACGKIEGYTTSTGEFSCSDVPIEFSIGAYALGTLDKLTDDGRVFPQDLIDGVSRDNTTDEKVVKMAQLLQSLDDDGNISNIIKIDKSVESRFNELGEEINGLDLDSILAVVDKDKVVADNARKHLQETMRSALSDSLEGEEEGIIDNILDDALGGK
ncbi:hypothetical protein GSY74_08345 [Sulfurovum sp. bin170]|uniref:hypothetical protein n=1 Tax=Sulfurovum sp. bin170 TaxID=2695268 RepID=UPI0013DEE50D|nr:hypothetical protein [Sulfurovum sp. bin170]NEW61291.1 hypothetical protein [Sulfurovum sp. bin170]